MIRRHIFYGLSAVVALAAAAFLSGCGGGGSSAPAPGGTLTGSSAVSSSAVSRAGRESIANVRPIQQIARPRQGNRVAVSRGRQAIAFDDETALYYRVQMNPDGARIDYFEDSGGQRPAGTILYRETAASYEIIVDIQRGRQPQRAYFKLAETGRTDRVHLIARYEDRRTGEKTSVEGNLVVSGAARSRQDDGDDDPYDWEDEWDWGEWGGNEGDWYDDYDWWDDWDETNDEYFGDDYFGEEDDFFGDEEYFDWEEESETGAYNDIGDFEIVRFEGEMIYEGCGMQVTISNAQLDFSTSRLTGTIQVDGASGSVDYNYEIGQGQIALNTAQGQVTIQFNGDVIEARYPDGRIERVNLNQWANPCAGVSRSSRASFPNSAPHTLARSALAKVGS